MGVWKISKYYGFGGVHNIAREASSNYLAMYIIAVALYMLAGNSSDSHRSSGGQLYKPKSKLADFVSSSKSHDSAKSKDDTSSKPVSTNYVIVIGLKF